MNREHLVLFMALIAALLVAGCADQLPEQVSSVMGTDGNGETNTGGDNTQTNTNEEKDSGNDGKNVVRYTSNGFEPSTIHISQGESVTWINEGNKEMWVASDIHPAHRAYDGTSIREHCNNGQSDTFDQCSTGDRYTFTFDKPGSWAYHNHEFSGHQGKVVVE